MPISSPLSTNRFTPIGPTSTGAVWDAPDPPLQIVQTYETSYRDLQSGIGSVARRVEDFIQTNGASNPPFTTSTAGNLTDNHTGKIVRGFIRRSAPKSGDPMSMGSLNFMYNPAEITRDYVSYLESAALDPFNTLYDSGNLVMAPNFVNFSFQLLFDRQIEAARGTINDGVLADYKYFDMVVRNVPPTSESGIPDNGIMMVNPEDITVVFSKDLTVQGRPTNARVSFIKFDNSMVPTRMLVDLTLIITYLGPLRQAIGYDTYQDIPQYSALVPYDEIYNEEYTRDQFDVAMKEYEDSQRAAAEFVGSMERQSPYSALSATSGAAGAVAGSSEIVTGASSEIAAKTLASARNRGTGNRYRLGANGPDVYDCSGFMNACYADHGVAHLLGGRGTSEMVRVGESSGWSAGMAAVVNTQRRGNAAQEMVSKAQPGDVLLRAAGGGRPYGHVGFVDGKTSDGSSLVIRHSTSRGPNGGEYWGPQNLSVSSLNTYHFLIRPRGA